MIRNMIKRSMDYRVFRLTELSANSFCFTEFASTYGCMVFHRTLHDSVTKRALDDRSHLKSSRIPINSIVSPTNTKISSPTQEDLAKIQRPYQNAELLRVTACKSSSSQNFSSHPPGNESAGSKNRFRWLLTALALGGAGIGVYYVKFHGEKLKTSEKTSGEGTSLPVRAKVPLLSTDLPKEVPYLLIGGGTASFCAFRAIKSRDPKAKVLVITSDFDKPYMRPPLSKELWLNSKPGKIVPDFKFTQWNGAERSVFYEPNEFYIDPTSLMSSENGGVAIAHGYTVQKLDVYGRKAILSDGTEISYGECLIATGCKPRKLNVFDAAPADVREKISTYSTLDDFVKLRKLSEKVDSFAIVGGSFLGSELSCSLLKYGEPKKLKIHQIFHESGHMAEILPEYLSRWTTEQLEELGVNVMAGASVEEVSLHNKKVKLELSNGKSILTDHVVVCAGSDPNVEIAALSNLEIDGNRGGILVNAEMLGRGHVYAAGDVASFYDPLLGRRRIEHHDHAVISGRLAGENMTGLNKPFTHQSMFWSDLGPSIGYEGIGIVDSSLRTVGIFAKASPESTTTDSSNSKRSKTDDNFEKGVVFYLQNEKVVGVLLWNLFNRISIARKVINENKKFDDLNEVAKLFDIHT